MKGLPTRLKPSRFFGSLLGGTAIHAVPLRLGCLVGRISGGGPRIRPWRRWATPSNVLFVRWARCVVALGEAGWEETTLVSETARAAFNAGACVLFGLFAVHPPARTSSSPKLSATTSPTPRRTSSGPMSTSYGLELAGLVPVLASRHPDLPVSKATDADTERFLFLGAVVGLLEMVAARAACGHRP